MHIQLMSQCLIKHQKDPLKELAANKSEAFFKLQRQTIISKRASLLPVVIMGWQANKSCIYTGSSLEFYHSPEQGPEVTKV